ncbi:MAG: hypothetical protein R3F48_10895 [Candidatus Zixiibacteriota bacterium]
MSKYRLPYALLLCLVLMIFGSLSQAGDIKVEFGSSTISTQNVLNNSTDIYDAYSATVIGLKTYPFHFLEISLSGEQDVYREVSGLSNSSGNLDITLIPTAPGARLSILLSGGISGRKYHEDFSSIDNNYGQVSAVLGYQVQPNLFARLGGEFRSTAYISTDNDYKRDIDLFAGLNLSLLGKGSLDIEAGFSGTNYSFKDAYLPDSIPHWDQPDRLIPTDRVQMFRIPETKENLWLFFFSPRISRQIGSRTGANIVYTKRIFQNYNNGFLWGENTGYLSPWSTIWEGDNISLNIKSFILPKFILKAGLGYWDKRYPVTSASEVWSETGITGDNAGYVDLTYGEAKETEFARNDFVTKAYFGIQLPFAFHSGLFIEPSLNIEYTDNRSNKDSYNYDNFSITTGITMRF